MASKPLHKTTFYPRLQSLEHSDEAWDQAEKFEAHRTFHSTILAQNASRTFLCLHVSQPRLLRRAAQKRMIFSIENISARRCLDLD